MRNIYDVSLSHLSTKNVVDANGKTIGRIKDAVVNLNTFQLRGWVLIGSKTEELLEDLKVIKDVDPFITVKNIVDRTDTTITLNKAAAELQNVRESGFLTENESLFSEIRKKPVRDKNGNKLGIFTDIMYEGESCVFQLGGKEFIQFLQSKLWTDNLPYLVKSTHISYEEEQFKINTDLKEIERDLKLNMTNLLRELLKEADKDGKITGDEKALISSITIDLATYNDALVQALEDNVIDQDEEAQLEAMKERILDNAYLVATIDQTITSDEKQLIEKLAAYLIDRRKELLWKIFGTT